jgi:2-C-methyl-D-erythritol 4-phosphate cytidylyltransferase
MPPQTAAVRAGVILLAVPGQTSAGLDALRTQALARPLAAWALAALRETPALATIVLVVERARRAEARALAGPRGASAPRVAVVPDGATVGVALRAGLDAFSPSVRLVVVQEAVRPLVTPDLLAAGLAAFSATPDLVAACAASPMKETVKRVRDGIVVETLDRSRLALLQAPMVFARAALEGALSQGTRAGGAIWSLADLLRILRDGGGRIATFPGGAETLAVATPDDLALAEQLLRARPSS